MRTHPRLIELAGLLSIIGASALIYALFGEVALAVTDTVATGMYQLWRGNGAAGKEIEEEAPLPRNDTVAR